MAGLFHSAADAEIRSARERRLLTRLLGKLAASIADQGVTSSANFLLNVFLARLLSGPEYGAYSVCWSILLVLAAIHNALILEPMTVVGPFEYQANLNAYWSGVRKLNWWVVIGLALLAVLIGMVYPQVGARMPIFVIAFCLPGFLLLLVARRWEYVVNRPLRALWMSCLYATGIFSCVSICRITGRLSAATAVASLGVSWLIGWVFLGRSAHPARVNEIARQHWKYGKWLFASAILAIGVSDMQTILLSMLVNLRSAGALRALMNFVLPLSQLLTVVSVYTLPRLAERAKVWGTQRLFQWGVRYLAAMIALLVSYLILLTWFAPQLERFLYAGKMRTYVTLVPLLAASAFASGIGAAFSTLLRAVQNSQHQFIAGVTGCLVGVGCALYVMRPMGLAGALWSMIAANASSTAVIVATYFWILRRKNA